MFENIDVTDKDCLEEKLGKRIPKTPLSKRIKNRLRYKKNKHKIKLYNKKYRLKNKFKLKLKRKNRKFLRRG
jgi:hypothetical protein